MAIDQEILILTAREMLTEADPALVLSNERLHALVQPALAEWYDRTSKSEEKRKNFLVETDDVQISSGVAELAPAMDKYGISAEMVKKADIFDPAAPADVPLGVRFVNSRNRLNLGGIQDAFYLMAYFDGKNIYFADTSLSGTMKLRVPVIPQDISQIPAGLTGEIARIIAELVRKFDYPRGEQKGVDLAINKDVRK